MKTNNQTLNNTSMKQVSYKLSATFAVMLLTACGSNDDSGGKSPEAYPDPAPEIKQFEVVESNDLNSKSNALLSLNPGGPGGSSNQSLRAGSVLLGGDVDDIIIGGLGVDILMGYSGDDILIGGTEDFNSNVDGDDNGSDNRDRAFGGDGDDAFIWAPGDGSDFFDGGDGIDVVMFGILGEAADASGNTEGAPFFAVNPPGTDGSQDFDGIYLDDNSQPVLNVSGSPGFCSILATNNNESAFAALEVDNVVRFSLRGIADQFDAGDKTDDDGLRVAVTLKNTEYVVCTTRVIDDTNSANNIEVFDISADTPVVATITDLPEYIQNLIQ